MSRNHPAYPRIQITGDSFSGGLYATAGNSYRELLFPLLQGINYLNGTTLWQSWAITGGRMADQALIPSVAFPDCDLLFVQLGQNDLARTTDQFLADTRTCFNYIGTLKCAVIVIAIPFQPGWWGQAYGTKALAFNAILEFEALIRGFKWAGRWQEALTPAGISSSGDVIAASATAADGYHPNNAGHLQLLNALWLDVEPMLKQALRRPASAIHVDVSGTRTEATGRTAA